MRHNLKKKDIGFITYYNLFLLGSDWDETWRVENREKSGKKTNFMDVWLEGMGR